jgi:hypothetical protein
LKATTIVCSNFFHQWLFVGTSNAKYLSLKQPFCKSKGPMKMKMATTTNMKEKMVTTYIHKMVVLASKIFHVDVVAKTN